MSGFDTPPLVWEILYPPLATLLRLSNCSWTVEWFWDNWQFLRYLPAASVMRSPGNEAYQVSTSLHEINLSLNMLKKLSPSCLQRQFPFEIYKFYYNVSRKTLSWIRCKKCARAFVCLPNVLRLTIFDLIIVLEVVHSPVLRLSSLR